MKIEEAARAYGRRVRIKGPLTLEDGVLIYTSDTHAFVRIDGQAELSPFHPVWLTLLNEDRPDDN